MRAACLAPFDAGGHRGQDQQGRKQPRYRSKQSHDSPRIFDEPILTATPWIATPKRGIGHLIPWRAHHPPEMRTAARNVPFRLRDESQPFIDRSEEHTSELQSLMRISYAVFCLKKKTPHNQRT